jgi:hypothetical protein
MGALIPFLEVLQIRSPPGSKRKRRGKPPLGLAAVWRRVAVGGVQQVLSIVTRGPLHGSGTGAGCVPRQKTVTSDQWHRSTTWLPSI